LQHALKTLAELAAHSKELFDEGVCKQLKGLYLKVPLKVQSRPIHYLLERLYDLGEDNKEKLSLFCYKIKDSADDFNDVLIRVEAHTKELNAHILSNKGELIHAITYSGLSNKKLRTSVARILETISNLVLFQIRDLEAQALVTTDGLVGVTEKSKAAEKLWQYLSSYNSNTDRDKLKERLSRGGWWTRFLDGKEVSTIITAYKLSTSL
jgi:hypothetical protein